MKVLLDTHTFIWADSDPSKLTARVSALIRDPNNTVFLSIASLWEIQIKFQAGKLSLRIPLPELVKHQQQTNQIVMLPVTVDHVYGLEALPTHHRDPFDRILIAQAQVENLTMLSHDAVFAQYPIQVIW
ncbi:MAG: type II toxin-antitoxin system VapC family toxin [Anaerolineae bacterium]|nr:type II toxin-antitoxin system VapC family toxin [Anaerolineae bacterium]